MELYDVGMASMLAMEVKALAELSLSAFNPPRQQTHDHLMSRLATLTTLIGEHLWDNDSGIFVNKFTTNLSFYHRISPTSFYPMQVGLVLLVLTSCHRHSNPLVSRSVPLLT